VTCDWIGVCEWCRAEVGPKHLCEQMAEGIEE
jgi:hypothetical protein